MLSQLGIHELRPVDDGVLQRLAPQTMVLAFAPFSEGNPAATTDNLNKARRHIFQRQQLLPRTTFFIRWWEDDHRSRRVSANDFAARFFPLHVPGTVMLASNEDAVDKDNAAVYRETVAWWAACVRLATAAKVQLAVGCMATGNPDYPQYAELVPLLTAMRDAARGGVVHWFYSNAYFDPNDPGYREHHLERHQREVRKVCDAHRLPMPPFVMGEFGIAYEYKALEGYKARDLDIEVYAARVCIEGNRLGVPYNVYAAGEGIFDTRWSKFNIDDPRFWTLVTQQAKRVPADVNSKMEQQYMSQSGTIVPRPPNAITEPPPDFRWGLNTPKWVTTKTDGANVRRAPDVNAQRIVGIVGRLKVRMFAASWTNPDDKQVWRRIILPSGITGFVAESAIEKIEDAPETAPLPPLPPITPVSPAPPIVVPPPLPPILPPATDNAALRDNILSALREMEIEGEAAARNLLAQAEAAKRFRDALATLWNIPQVNAQSMPIQAEEMV